MANHHSFQKNFNNRVQKSKISTGLSKSLVNEGFPRNQESIELKKMDSTRIFDSEIIESNQDRKRRCFEKLLMHRERVESKCALEVEVIDDTALIEATGSVSGVKKGFKKESDAGFRNRSGNDGKKNNNKKGSKKQDTRCSMKCLNEKKCKDQVVEDRIVTEKKKVPEGKTQKMFRKKFGKVKSVYQRKDVSKIPKLVETGVENQTVPEKIVQETEVNSNISNVVTQDKDLTVELVESEIVNKKDDIEVHTKNVCEIPTVESKKIVYSRGELEALRFVNEDGQKSKWVEIYGRFSPLVAKEYVGLVVDVNNRLTQRYNNRMVNSVSAYTRNAGGAILSMPPILPMCSSLVYRKIAPYDHVGFGKNFY